MKLFDYSELIRVINNVEFREEREKTQEIMNIKEQYINLKKEIINSGILDDWYRLKQLCSKANIRLSVSHQGSESMGRIIGHSEDFKYCQEYKDNGLFCKCMSSGSHWSDYFGFDYETGKDMFWKIYHTTNSRLFLGFGAEDVKKEYETKITLLKTFRDTYEDYRDFQLKKIEDKFQSRIKPEDIIKGVDKNEI